MTKRTSTAVSATQDWKNRMARARARLPEGIGQMKVIAYITELAPELDKLTNANRWHNAWNMRTADTEITPLVEAAADHFATKATRRRKGYDRLNLAK